MKKWMVVLALLGITFWGSFGFAAGKTSSQGHAHGELSGTKTMEHTAPAAGTFTHKAVVDGIRAEFQIMSLASMNMKDPGGATHHVMVTFFHDSMNHQITDMVGKVKVIAPSSKDQVADLKNYSGVYAANFTFDEKGKYGVICLFKIEEKKYTVKFWYPHE